jgi:hypothetical protein
VNEAELADDASNDPFIQKAGETRADIVIILHPDYLCIPKRIHSMVNLIAGRCIPGKGALSGGMPLHKCISTAHFYLFKIFY